MVTEVTDANFDEEVLKSDIPVLVDFWASWCGPCKSMLPIVDGISAEYEGRIKVVKINVDENSELPGRFSIMSIPTFIIFKDGHAAATFVGAKSKEDMKKEVEAVL